MDDIQYNNACLLVIDMQNDAIDFFPGHKDIIPNILKLTEKFRQKGLPVIHLLTEYETEDEVPRRDVENQRIMFMQGTEGAKEVTELYNAEDYYIKRKKYSPFNTLEFNELLKRFDVDVIVITGILTHCCVYVTALDAYQNEYDVVVIKDGVDSYRKELHENLLKYFKESVGFVYSTEELIEVYDGTSNKQDQEIS